MSLDWKMLAVMALYIAILAAILLLKGFIG